MDIANNSIINCKDFGRVHFISCHNCTIQGITWDGCGTDDPTESALKLSNSSNVNINNCFFQYSKGQALLLSETTGDVNIDHCEFVHNSHYRGHGAAIHYSSSNVTNGSVFMISDCNFAYNSAKSLVYTDNTISKHKNIISFHSAKFCHNQGVSVYAVNENYILNGKIAFYSNRAENGTGIYISDHSTVTFSETSYVTFTQNLAKFIGGTIFLRNYSNVIFDKYSKVIFNNNRASVGGTIYSEVSSNITFRANCKVTFSNNSASVPRFFINAVTYSAIAFGGAIYSRDSHVTFKGNSSVVFDNNAVTNYGGAICTLGSSLSFEDLSTVVFRNNIAEYGGAVFTQDQSDIIFSDDSKVTFTNNSATFGATAFSKTNSKIIATGNSTVILNDHSAKWCNNTCLPYTGQGDVVTIDSNGIVWCSDQKAFVCVSKECDCDKLEDLLDGLELK